MLEAIYIFLYIFLYTFRGSQTLENTGLWGYLVEVLGHLVEVLGLFGGSFGAFGGSERLTFSTKCIKITFRR